MGNLLRLLGKAPPDLSRVGTSEKSASEMGNTIRAWVEEGIRWMFWVAAEREWFVFVGTVSALTYSASAVDRATVFCLMEAQENMPEPSVKAYPEVLLISSSLPAQSLSQYPIRVAVFPFANSIPKSNFSNITENDSLSFIRVYSNSLRKPCSFTLLTCLSPLNSCFRISHAPFEVSSFTILGKIWSETAPWISPSARASFIKVSAVTDFSSSAALDPSSFPFSFVGSEASKPFSTKSHSP
ncbi:Reticulan like protein B13 [Prunus dulcis]|uniref:Reticulan like protein B13 n=1 Tax=Prunus dulcis TaxID=3755 RepID=A0A5H2Y952_PRUDU|nr:Reticulan like protein B13 [Prunus dulcis]